ncbi:MAG TPA: hypothetical protein VLT61_09855 [Anaeromyxobacteraceae bacterium]|nr:hypothetical protein [Anaeromyxobacteraceae bacterium]
MTIPIRWFAPDALSRLVVPGLGERGYRVVGEGEAVPRAVVCISAEQVGPGWHAARRARAPLGVYLWDLPPWRLEGGRPDPVIDLGGRLVRCRSPRYGPRRGPG